MQIEHNLQTRKRGGGGTGCLTYSMAMATLSSGAKASMRLYALTLMVFHRVALVCEDDDLACMSRKA